MSRHRLTRAERQRRGAVDGWDCYVRENAVAIAKDLYARLERQSREITLLLRAKASLRAEVTALRRVNESLVARVAAQSELLSRRAEARPCPVLVIFGVHKGKSGKVVSQPWIGNLFGLRLTVNVNVPYVSTEWIRVWRWQVVRIH